MFPGRGTGKDEKNETHETIRCNSSVDVTGDAGRIRRTARQGLGDTHRHVGDRHRARIAHLARDKYALAAILQNRNVDLRTLEDVAQAVELVANWVLARHNADPTAETPVAG